MTFIDSLALDAKAGARELVVPESCVALVVEHLSSMTANAVDANGAIEPLTHEECEELLRDGQVWMHGVPMRVMPAGEVGAL